MAKYWTVDGSTMRRRGHRAGDRQGITKKAGENPAFFIVFYPIHAERITPERTKAKTP